MFLKLKKSSLFFNFFGLQGITIFSFCHDLFTLFKEKLQHYDYTWRHTKLQSPKKAQNSTS